MAWLLWAPAKLSTRDRSSKHRVAMISYLADNEMNCWSPSITRAVPQPSLLSHSSALKTVAMDLHKHYIRCHSKEASALFLLRANPAAWTGDVTLEELDLALLKADPVPFINYSKGSFLRKLVSIFRTSSNTAQTNALSSIP